MEHREGWGAATHFEATGANTCCTTTTNCFTNPAKKLNEEVRKEECIRKVKMIKIVNIFKQHMMKMGRSCTGRRRAHLCM